MLSANTQETRGAHGLTIKCFGRVDIKILNTSYNKGSRLARRLLFSINRQTLICDGVSFMPRTQFNSIIRVAELVNTTDLQQGTF